MGLGLGKGKSGRVKIVGVKKDGLGVKLVKVRDRLERRNRD